METSISELDSRVIEALRDDDIDVRYYVIDKILEKRDPRALELLNKLAEQGDGYAEYALEEIKKTE